MESTRLQVPPKGHFYLAGRLFPRKQWWKNKNMRALYFYVFILSFCNTANGFDNSVVNGFQALTFWQDYFGHPTSSRLGLLGSAVSLGAITGLFFLYLILDNWGRKPSLVFGASIMLVGVALQTAAQNFAMFVAGRWILGIGDIIVICTFPLLITEVAPTQDRAILVTLAATSYNVGAFIAAWTTFGTLNINNNWSWRAPSLIQGLFTIILLVFVYWMPESPRFYIARDKSEKALEVLAYYHADGDQNDEVVQLEYAEINTALVLEREAKKTSYLDFLRTRGNRKRLFILVTLGLFSQWSGNGLISYYLTPILDNLGITNSTTQLGINAGLTTWNLLTNVFFSCFVDKMGRRPLNLIGCVIMLVGFVIWTALSAVDAHNNNANSSIGIGIIFLIFFYYLGYALKYCSQASYASEILPYYLRSKGYTIMEYCLYGPLFFNQFVNPIALKNIGWKYYIFYCVALVLELIIVYFFYVETRYTPLEEITRLFDGDEVAVDTIANEEVKTAGEKGQVEISHIE